MTSGKLWWLGAGCLTLAASLLVWSWPYASSTFHLEAGGRALERALPNTDALDWWYVGPREAQNRQELQAAIAHLEQAPKMPYALRLLGRAYFSQGDLPRGVEALERFVEERPDHRLGHLELAAAYALMDQRLQEIEYVDLVDRLEGAAVSAPDLNGQVHFQPEDWKSEYVYPTTFGLPPNYGDRPTLFVHAGSQVTYTVTLTEPSILRFGMGLDPRSLDWGGDGATFEVFVDGKRVFLEHLSTEQAHKGWQEREVDLRSYTGQSLQLALVTTPGPRGDIAADWAGWGEPRLEAPEAAAYRQIVSGKPWVKEWYDLDLTASDFVRTGQMARRAAKYEDAVSWYQWAGILMPGRGDPWYYVGLNYEDQELWTQALDAYQQAIGLGHFWEVPDSSPYYRSGIIYQRHMQPPQLDAALAAFETAIAEDDFQTRREAADCHYRLGTTLLVQKASADAYIAEFEQAAALDPGHVWARVQLGVAIYRTDHNADTAEELILGALELSPRDKWIHYYLGELYRQEKSSDKARQSYEQALAIDPQFDRALERLQMLRGNE